MMLTLTASIMYWSLQQQVAESEDDEYASQTEGENETDLAGEVSGLDIDDSVSDRAQSSQAENEGISTKN